MYEDNIMNGNKKNWNKKSWNFCGIYYIKRPETYCVSCKEYTAKENSNVRKTNRNRLMLLLNCTTCSRKRLASVKNQELQNSDNISND